MRVEGKKRGFTLIELLVVVAIIVILIAVLVPALTAALYAATLASCAANQDTFATAVTLYAHSNKDNYPHRSVLDATGTGFDGTVDEVGAGVLVNGQDPTKVTISNVTGWMSMLKLAVDKENPGSGTQGGATNDFDDRPLWQTMVDVQKSMIDPFVEPIDLIARSPDSSRNSYDAEDMVASSYDILVGFGWNGEGRMQKLGSKTSWTAPTGQPDVNKAYTWDLLVMDKDMQVSEFVRTAAGSVNPDLDEWEPAMTSHPDKTGLMREYAVQNARDNDSGKDLWMSVFLTEGPRDNLVDRNFAHADGSVDSIRDIYAGRSSVGTLASAVAGSAGNQTKRQKFPAPYNHSNLPPFSGTFTAPGLQGDERMYVVSLRQSTEYQYGTILMPRR